MNYHELPTRSDETIQAVIKGLELHGAEHCAFFDACCLDRPTDVRKIELTLMNLLMKKIKDGVDVFILTNPDWFQLLAGRAMVLLQRDYNFRFFVVVPNAGALSKIPAEWKRDFEQVCDAAEYVFAMAKKTVNKVYFVEALVRWCGCIIRYADSCRISTMNENVNNLGRLYEREFINLKGGELHVV